MGHDPIQFVVMKVFTGRKVLYVVTGFNVLERGWMITHHEGISKPSIFSLST